MKIANSLPTAVFSLLLQFDMKPTPNQLLLQQQHFQQQMANEADNASNSSSLVTTRHGAGGHVDNRSTGGPGSESVSAPQTPNPSSTSSASSNLPPPLHLKLQDQHGQYPFAAVAAALHNQIPAAHNSRWVSCVLDVV